MISLPSIANNDSVGDKFGHLQLDAVLDGDGGHVLAPGRDDQLLEPAGHDQKPVLVEFAQIS